jgi:methionine sulfoxide reductase heme-binding subunit
MIIAATTPDASDHLYWLTSRAAGTAAMLFASAAVLVGVLRAAGLAGANVHGNRRRLELGIVHEMLGLACIATTLLHGFVLLGDNFLKPSIGDIVIPFYGPYEPTFNGIGIIAGYAFIVFGLTYYVRDRMGGEARWTVLHRLTVLAWAASVVHTLGEGTDRHEAWFKAVLFLPGIAALVFLVWRVVGSRRIEHPAA